MPSELTRNQRLLLFKFRDALKNAGIVFEGHDINLNDDHAGIRFSAILTDSDNTPFELFVIEYQEKPPAKAWTTNKNRLIST